MVPVGDRVPPPRHDHSSHDAPGRRCFGTVAILPILLAAAVAAAPDSVAPRDPREPHNGRAGRLMVAIPRLDESVVIDGKLDEAVWERAALLTGFSQFTPQDGVAADDSTEVLVWYSSTAIHFGIRAFERHGAVHATHADRDKISNDDNVQIFLGTFHDRRQAYVFGVNPFGVQMDGTIVERGQVLNGGWTGALASRVAPDLNQDFVFASKGRLTDYGYEVEIRIPFKSLKYQDASSQDWDIHIVRQVQHSGHEESWAPARRASASFLAQAGTLAGLAKLDRGLAIEANPVVTSKVVGGPATPGWAYGKNDVQVGGSARWGITNNLMLSGTAHPDFAEVESDAGKLIQDPRLALFFPEKRPFFLDGAEQFGVPSGLIYTRRIVEPVAAVKLSGKVGGTTVGVLSAEDDPSLSPSGRDPAYVNVMRLQRDLGGQSRLGVALTDREVGATYNRVADVDSRVAFGGVYSATAQWAQSWTQKATGGVDGALWSSSFARNGHDYGFRYAFNGSTDGFQAATGFLSRVGIAHGSADNHWTWFGQQGSAIDNITTTALIDETWLTKQFVRQGEIQDKKYHLTTSATLRDGWTLGSGVYWETFGFDDQLYAGYRILKPNGAGLAPDTLPFTGVQRIMNRDYVLSVNTPRFASFSGSLLYVWGQDENFLEWAQADIHFVSAALSFRPTVRLRIDANYDYQDFWRRSDHSQVGKNLIPRVKVEYQLTRSVFVRAVGQLEVDANDDLRDETRTNLPLLINGQLATAKRSQTFNGDLLFSYQPVPGTVVFVGYGGQADGPADPTSRFIYRPLIRDQDHLFVKMSWLFRS